MKRNHLAAIAAALAMVNATAATYTLDLTGAGIHQTSADEDVTWTGQVTVIVDGSADGVYAGDSLEAIDVTTNWTSFSYTKGNLGSVVQTGIATYLFVGTEPDPSVTVTGGKVTGIDFVFDKVDEFDAIRGLNGSAQTFCRSGDCHGIPDNIFLWSALTASAVPEPACAAFLLAGAAFFRRRLKAQ